MHHKLYILALLVPNRIPGFLSHSKPYLSISSLKSQTISYYLALLFKVVLFITMKNLSFYKLIK